MLAVDVHPDVVVLDFFMPRWDGAKAAAYMREHCPGTRIVAFSAVLTDAPDWGDVFVLKNEVQKLIPIVERLVQGPPGPLRQNGTAA